MFANQAGLGDYRNYPGAGKLSASAYGGNVTNRHQITQLRSFDAANSNTGRAIGFSDLDNVELIKPKKVGGLTLPAGSIGTVVHSYPNGNAFEVEFSQPSHVLVLTRKDEIRSPRG